MASKISSVGSLAHTLSSRKEKLGQQGGKIVIVPQRRIAQLLHTYTLMYVSIANRNNFKNER